MKTLTFLGLSTLLLSLAACGNMHSSADKGASKNGPKKAAYTQFEVGGVDGGGGKGVLCNGNLEVLDLYEARLNGDAPLASSGDLNEDVKKYNLAFAKHIVEGRYLSPALLDFTQPELQKYFQDMIEIEVEKKFVDIPAKKRLPLTADATLRTLPDGCEEVQIAVFADDGKIYRDLEYWQLLENIDKAALEVHEMYYHHVRQSGGKSSDDIRLVIGKIFAGKPIESLFGSLVDKDQLMSCIGGKHGTDAETMEFYGAKEIQDGVEGTRINFLSIKDTLTVGRITAFIPYSSLKQLSEGKVETLRIDLEDSLLGNQWVLELRTANIGEQNLEFSEDLGFIKQLSARVFSSREEALHQDPEYAIISCSLVPETENISLVYRSEADGEAAHEAFLEENTAK